MFLHGALSYLEITSKGQARHISRLLALLNRQNNSDHFEPVHNVKAALSEATLRIKSLRANEYFQLSNYAVPIPKSE